VDESDTEREGHRPVLLFTDGISDSDLRAAHHGPCGSGACYRLPGLLESLAGAAAAMQDRAAAVGIRRDVVAAL
jgi:hypothetical protein